MDNSHGKHLGGQFLDEPKIKEWFENKLPEGKKGEKTNLQNWYEPKNDHEFTYRHDDQIGVRIGNGKKDATDNGCFTCDTLADKWFEWLLTTPKAANPVTNPSTSGLNTIYADTNAFLFGGDKECRASVYFSTASPFQHPDFRRIVMIKNAPLLIPVYNVVSSPEMFPSRKDYSNEEWIEKDIMEDLAGVNPGSITASLDGEDFWGCCVIRKEPYRIRNIPKDNLFGVPENILRDNHSTIRIYHGGFWLLIKEEYFTPGDHLLSFQAVSKNYEIDAKILITALW